MPDTTETGESFERLLGERLIALGRIDAAGLERALRLHRESGERLDVLLTKLGMVGERDMAALLAEVLGLALVDADDYPDDKVIESEVSPRFLRDSRVLPLAQDGDRLVLAMADPLDEYAKQAIELICGTPVTPRVAVPMELEAAIERIHDSAASIGEIVDAAGPGEVVGDDDIERLKDLASEAPVIRLVNVLIGRAVESRTSDIHIEPFENALRVRYRVDGILREVESPPAGFRADMVSRVKIMAGLNIAERRRPQDGRVKLAVRGREIDLRVSTVPTMHGENVVLRVLDRDQALDLASLGFGDHVLGAYRQLLARPHGIILATGPTGSGKTTTLYASLLELNSPDRKILTVEDPIEYQLQGVNQVQVKPDIGLDFANLLRSLLRQDPDIMMVGEIHDLETAEIAVQAALTGHLVLSTLHTNNAAGTIPRLLDMGVDDYLLVSTVNGVIAQRLVRTLCPQCRAPVETLPEMVRRLGIARYADGNPVTLHRPVGCAACNGTGFKGRTTILELMEMTDGVRRLVLNRSDPADIERAARADGMRGMFEDGVRKALAGITTMDEILRATRAE